MFYDKFSHGEDQCPVSDFYIEFFPDLIQPDKFSFHISHSSSNFTMIAKQPQPPAPLSDSCPEPPRVLQPLPL